MKDKYDVVIIGAGVSGCSAAYYLSRYKLKILLIEKESDVCEGTSKANSAIVHAGFDPTPGTLMAKLNIEGSRMMEALSKDLDFPYKKNGALVVSTNKESDYLLKELFERGNKNGVKDLRIVKRDELLRMEKNISDNATSALYAPSSAIMCPFSYNIAMAEVAFCNGVRFRFNTRVENISKQENGLFCIKCNTGIFYSSVVVNAAGVFADELHNMVLKNKMTIIPRKGEYMLLDKTAGNFVSHTVFPLPSAMGKGILVTPTVHGNVLLGPTAEDIEDKNYKGTTPEGLGLIKEKCSITMKNVPIDKVITSFAGLRAHDINHRFTIEETEEQGFIDCAGIESPGLTAAPAIGKMVTDIVLNRLNPREKLHYLKKREGIIKPSSLSKSEYKKLIKRNPDYGIIICKCNGISKGEIVDSITRVLGAKTLGGVKRRTTSLMGACQGGFCTSEIIKLLEYYNNEEVI